MTHQNHQTNGASLEDCHTNFFSLTELYGIKWRKLVWGETTGGGGEGEEGAAPLADPVISSYARCLAGDILCVWRRVPAPQPQDIYEMSAPPAPPPPLSLRAAKELWIFWYGEEPDLNGLVAPELIAGQGDQGSWESGLSYECRSLLFKALHNLIERCLLSRDFVRLGKWFVQPYDGDEEDVGKSPWHLSFSFAFFLHGESTVCASVDVRQHPPVRTLTAKRLAKLNGRERSADADNKVILAPFGLEGTVTGRDWSDSDAPTARLLDAWRQLYPLEQGCGAVEVVCGGVRMRYPLPYVLVTGMEPPPAPPPAAPLAAAAAAALTTPKPHLPAEVCYAECGDKGEDFVDPTRKTPCTCAKGGCAGLGLGAASPGSCGAGSPAAAGSAPPSAGAPHSPHQHTQPQQTTLPHQSALPPTTLHTPAPTPDPLAPPTPAPPSAPPPTKLYPQGDSPRDASQTNNPSPVHLELLKRPVLPRGETRVDPLEDEHSLHMLYDYTTVHAWLEHPVKRFKSDENTFREELALGSAGGDLYAGHDHTRMAVMPDHKDGKHDHDDAAYKNLYTSDGLCPTLKDLDQIFENSDDAASGDETVRLLQVQTPPDSNKSFEETRGRMVRAEELSKMFPTPPSLEPHAAPSPGFTLELEPLRHAHSHAHPHLTPHATPPHEPIEDWSYVFKPPTVYKCVGSSKYAPLLSLPSSSLPPVTLPPHAVYRPRWQQSEEEPQPQTGNKCAPLVSLPSSSLPPVTLPPHAVYRPRWQQSEEEPQPQTGTKRPASPLASPAKPPATPLPGAAPPSTSPAAAAAPRAASPASPATPRAACKACPLLLNVLLADTVLNVFRDHNFDSCTLCVCNAGPKVVGNIRGADASTYLPETAEAADEDPGRCTCGFSAVVNRRLAHKAGLFYEDEMEITGIAEIPARSSTRSLGSVAGAVLGMCAALGGGGASALTRAARHAARERHDQNDVNLLEYSDGGAACMRALRAAGAGAAAGAVGAAGAAGAGAGGACHRWPFIGARAPRCSRDVIRLMRRLRPLLQDAIQKRCCGARMWDGVAGPLTWRQFHRLAGRSNEDLCEPQPVPPLLVGHDRDWISLSPYALRHWERLSLEPYSYSRDVAYVVLAADGEVLTDPIKTFFRELSTAYESCRLGRHQPINRIARDGLIRTSPSDRDQTAEEWTGELPAGRLGEYIKSYAETLRTSIVPQLASLSIDRSLLETETKSAHIERPAPSPMRPPSTPDHPPTPSSQSDQENETPNMSSSANNSTVHNSWEEEEGGAPALVVYVVEPPASHAHRAHSLHALLRLAARTHHHLRHHNPLVKIISLEGVCETAGPGAGTRSELRALAFSVFTGARRLLQPAPAGKSLTGFGTAAQARVLIEAMQEKDRAPYKLFSPAWVLAPPRALKEVAETWGHSCGEQGAVLFLSYCLSHDQRWLFAAATDARGELLDTHAVNIHVPHRSRRRRAAGARRCGLSKLMDWALGVMSQAAQPWRLVVGRLGRIGHGELKGWSWLLSRKNLTRASNQLKDICHPCSVLYPSGAPCILSACLVSTEPDSCLRLMADRFTPDERFSQASIQSHLHTPRDVTATHILVFPTSATATQSAQGQFEQSAMANGETDDMMFLGVDMNDMNDDEINDSNMTDLLIGDMFNNMWPQGSPRNDGGREEDAAADEDEPQRNVPQASYAGDDHSQEQVGTVLQQPLALGYMVSTAPLDAMPAWWWAGCPHLRDACPPAFLKNALHLHTGSVQAADDFTSLTQRSSHVHPLDSQVTTDVLRYVLEGYNALSWLALDGETHDRRSCLPLHVQVLMQLYHTAAALG
ncbi:mediator of RNA polymerase II transcription subunit 13-like [Cydia strobilella]|uniref:mediator of RNA polymerase II transcription subunit 13-like n=1 Tax=Cydia strobilella TaxID=1100964 RepID=UPI003004610D